MAIPCSCRCSINSKQLPLEIIFASFPGNNSLDLWIVYPVPPTKGLIVLVAPTSPLRLFVYSRPSAAPDQPPSSKPYVLFYKRRQGVLRWAGMGRDHSAWTLHVERGRCYFIFRIGSKLSIFVFVFPMPGHRIHTIIRKYSYIIDILHFYWCTHFLYYGIEWFDWFRRWNCWWDWPMRDFRQNVWLVQPAWCAEIWHKLVNQTGLIVVSLGLALLCHESYIFVVRTWRLSRA